MTNLWVYYLLGSGGGFRYKSYLPNVPNFFENRYLDVVLAEYCLQVEKSSRLHLNLQRLESPPRLILEELKNWSLGRSYRAANTNHMARVQRATIRHVWGTNLKEKPHLITSIRNIKVGRPCVAWHKPTKLIVYAMQPLTSNSKPINRKMNKKKNGILSLESQDTDHQRRWH